MMNIYAFTSTNTFGYKTCLQLCSDRVCKHTLNSALLSRPLHCVGTCVLYLLFSHSDTRQGEGRGVGVVQCLQCDSFVELLKVLFFWTVGMTVNVNPA